MKIEKYLQKFVEVCVDENDQESFVIDFEGKLQNYIEISFIDKKILYYENNEVVEIIEIV